MVEARTLIQNELLELLTFKRTNEAHLDKSAWLRVTGLLASAGFSLWRAAFLFTHETGQHETYLQNVDRFIEKIVSDNTIAFSDDKNTWSLWHYIGVARSSLLEASGLILQGEHNKTALAILRSKLEDAPLLHASAAEQWRELFDIMQRIRSALTARIQTKERFNL